MIRTIFKNWSIARIVRLLLGSIILIQAIANNDSTIIVLASLFLFMPILNIGCGNQCSITPIKPQQKETAIVHEEITKP